MKQSRKKELRNCVIAREKSMTCVTVNRFNVELKHLFFDLVV
jgi:hypothetical protein